MFSQQRQYLLFPSILFCVILLGALALLTLATGCGGGGGNDIQASPPSPTMVQFKVGDAPSDRLLALELNLDAVHVVNSQGVSVNVLPATRRLEFLHTAGTLEPVALLEIPQGTYTQATFQGSGIHVSYVSLIPQYPYITEHEVSSAGGSTITASISPALVVGAQPVIVSVDLNLKDWVTFDSSDLPVLGNPTFTITSSTINTSGPQKPETGGLESMYGVVTAVSATDFVLSLGQNAMPLTFTTDSNTVFTNTSLSTLPSTIVKVNGVTQADGTVLAKEVTTLENTSGLETEGVIYFDWSNRTTPWFWLTPQDGNGSGFEFRPTPQIGQVINVDITNTSYFVNTDGMDMTGAAFTFDANADPTSMRFGQRVRVESSTGMIPDTQQGTAGYIKAQKVTLEKQMLGGVVSDYQVAGGRASFVLNLPPDSYLTMLNAPLPPVPNYINVWQQAGTDLHGISSVQNGDSVSVRGLLFSSSGDFVMVAERIEK